MIVDPTTIDRNTGLTADVCVIGSGAGGAFAAMELAEAGHDVVVLEEGQYLTSDSFTGETEDCFPALFREGGMIPIVGVPPVVLSEGCCVGGSTVVNGGTSWRIPPAALSRWQNEHGLSELTEAHLTPYYEHVEEVISVKEVTEDIAGEQNRRLIKGLEKLGWSGGYVKRNYKDCVGSGVCGVGCPTDAKQSMLVSTLPRAAAAGARIFANCRVSRILAPGGEIWGVKAHFLDPQTRRPTYELRVRCKVLVLAAGSVQSAVLLQGSRVATQSGQVGKNFLIHPLSKAMGIYPDPVDGFNGVVQGVYSDQFLDEGMLLLTAMLPPEIVALSLPYHGRDHARAMARFRSMSCLGALVCDTTTGRVRRLPNGRPLITYQLTKADRQNLVRSLALAAEALFASGVEEVVVSLPRLGPLKSPDDIARLYQIHFRPLDFELATLHPMGTCRFGGDPSRHVVNPDGETYGVKNLFVADASVFPTSLGVNPQIAVMTLAVRCAERIRGRLG